ncbi:hypothetical protein PIB30_095015, partial [Stylosanthes scabra]|nr:hypothetical protein [Stylosanthes scabra]
LNIISGCGTSLVTILPSVSNLPKTTAMPRPVRINVTHVCSHPHSPWMTHLALLMWGFGMMVGPPYEGQYPSGMGGENGSRYTLKTSDMRYTSWT